MKYLFSKTGKQVLESLSFTKSLYAFDFDGTLAPIVSQPEAANMSLETKSLLNDLSKLETVTVISGRAIKDLRKRVNIAGNLLIGNHGVEGLGVKKDAILASQHICKQWLEQLKKSWGNLSIDPGTFVENKTYSLALHYRKSRNKKKIKMELFSLIEKLEPSPRVILGKSVINLIPSGGPHKGIALLEAMRKLDLKCAFYIGDDDTDEDVFSLPDSRIITTRIALKKNSQAQFFLKRQNEINQLLRFFIKINSNK